MYRVLPSYVMKELRNTNCILFTVTAMVLIFRKDYHPVWYRKKKMWLSGGGPNNECMTPLFSCFISYTGENVFLQP